jgi:hypothetical protein
MMHECMISEAFIGNASLYSDVGRACSKTMNQTRRIADDFIILF